MEFGLGEFIATIERYYGRRVAQFATAFTAVCGGLVLLGLTVQFAIAPARRSIIGPLADWLIADTRYAGVLASFLSAIVFGLFATAIAHALGGWLQRSWTRASMALLQEIRYRSDALTRLYALTSHAVGRFDSDIEQQTWLLAGALPDEARSEFDASIQRYLFEVDWLMQLARREEARFAEPSRARDFIRRLAQMHTRSPQEASSDHTVEATVQTMPPS